MTQGATGVAAERPEREPICGLCWSQRRYVPLDYIVAEDVWYCRHCGARTHHKPPDDEEDAVAQAFYRQEGGRTSFGIPGNPPWRQGLSAGPPRKRGGGSRSGRRRKKQVKGKPWYQRGGAG